MKIIVTGANGQVGQELRQESVNQKYKIFFLDKSNFDLCNRINMNKQIYKIKPHAIINLASYTNVKDAEKNREECFKINKEGTSNLAKICKENSILLFHISSDYVFDGNKKDEYNEEDTTSPINVYGNSKLISEEIIKNQLEKFIIIRTSWVFSSYKRNFVKSIILSIINKGNLEVVTEQIGGPTSAKNLAKILFLFCNKYEEEGKLIYGIYHFSNLPYVTWYDFAKKILSILKSKKYLKIDENFLIKKLNHKNDAVDRPLNSMLSNKKINNYLGIGDLYWESSLNECLDKLKKENFYEN